MTFEDRQGVNHKPRTGTFNVSPEHGWEAIAECGRVVRPMLSEAEQEPDNCGVCFPDTVTAAGSSTTGYS